jgi:ferredoxin
MNTIDEFCARCCRKMRVAKVGQEVIELIERGGKPYKHMCGDVLECPECHCLVVTRFGKVTAQHDEGFEERVESARIIGFLGVV